MPVPQRLNFVTIGAWSVSALRDFYRHWGWRENEGGSDDYVSFRVGSVVLAIFPIDRLADEAATNALTRERDGWNGVTFSINFTSRADVDRAIADAVAVGGSAVGDPVEREWGGYSGYVADVEGNRWEFAWAPGFDPE
ncbi:MAG TPA: VOC family protein [Acidimicrobiales bacterium]|jgi:uncharacterized protein|nr:VOC family protein [Acidimicrobiales bacterium]